MVYINKYNCIHIDEIFLAFIYNKIIYIIIRMSVWPSLCSFFLSLFFHSPSGRTLYTRIKCTRHVYNIQCYYALSHVLQKRWRVAHLTHYFLLGFLCLPFNYYSCSLALRLVSLFLYFSTRNKGLACNSVPLICISASAWRLEESLSFLNLIFFLLAWYVRNSIAFTWLLTCGCVCRFSFMFSWKRAREIFEGSCVLSNSWFESTKTREKMNGPPSSFFPPRFFLSPPFFIFFFYDHGEKKNVAPFVILSHLDVLASESCCDSKGHSLSQ